MNTTATFHNRIQAIDSTRGFAMLLVCVSHFFEIFTRSSHHTVQFVFYLTRIAAPTFMVISGIMLGFFYATKKDKFRQIKIRFFNRGLFMLLVAHIVIGCSYIYAMQDAWVVFKFVYITDSVGLNIILGPLVIEKLKPSKRISVSLLGITLSWFLTYFWNPNIVLLEVSKEVFFGDLEYSYFHFLHYAFPFMPWFCLYLASTCIGEKLAEKRGENANRSCFFLFKLAVLSCGIASLGKLLFMTLKYMSPQIFDHLVFYGFTSPFAKSPPSLAYFLFYGGVGLAILSFQYYFQQFISLRHIYEFFSVFGRNSLFVFMIQYYVYYVGVYVLHLTYSISNIAFYLIGSILLLFFVARLWERKGLNRLLSLPLLSP
jgi:uncharacterized membrane protein